MSEVCQMSVEEYTLLDEETPSAQPVAKEEEEAPKDETDDQRKQRLLGLEMKKQEEKQRTEISTVTRLYSESFLARLLRLVELFASISASNMQLMSMAKSISSPESLAVLVNTLMVASPRIKYLVIRIFTALVQMKLPLELFEEAVNLQDQDSCLAQMFKKSSPALKFKRSKFLAFLH